MAADHPGLAEVHEPAPLGQVGHQRPEVHQCFLKSLVGAGPGLYPPQTHPGALRRFIDDFNRQPAKTAVRPNLERGICLEADTKRMLRNWRETGSKIPVAQDAACYPQRYQGRSPSLEPA